MSAGKTRPQSPFFDSTWCRPMTDQVPRSTISTSLAPVSVIDGATALDALATAPDRVPAHLGCPAFVDVLARIARRSVRERGVGR